MEGQRPCKSCAQLVADLRSALAPVLPNGPSLVACDILTAVALAENAGMPLTMKQLLAGLPYSATGVRYNLATLLEDGWIYKESSGSDRRLVHLRTSARLEKALGQTKANVLAVMAANQPLLAEDP
ncbi:hypothetical protein GH984_05825 [Spiribacter sp. C176]|uniref:HTH marR-type domain-containing protein n=1 Tax=Spiribacter salilacus TaxID=2664894 RepID=A0A6N7QS40_9GAMM|nr:helix-turn-helix domain-containing protein [Spiribacter salilacus]MRH78219.1 hypothetical protein [Spiribacter salilacus]